MTDSIPNHLPSAQEIIAAFAQSLRLTAHPSFVSGTSSSTRKTFARGDRVKPAIRDEYVRGLAAAMNAHHCLFPLASRNEAQPPNATDADYIARGICEFAIAWELCVGDTLSYSGTVRSQPLAILPMIRLALEDIGLRVACHARGRSNWLLGAAEAEVADALAAGSAFMPTVRYLLQEHGLRRSDLTEHVPVDTVEGWERDGSLPSDANLTKLADFFLAHDRVRLGVQLDLRIAVALSEFWRWFKSRRLPEVAHVRMALGFVAWMRVMARWSERAHATGDAVAWTVLRGAHDPATALWWPTLAAAMPHPRLAADLEVLSTDWTPACRNDNGALGDLELAARDARGSLAPDSPDRSLQDYDLLAVIRCLQPPHRWHDESRRIIAPATLAETEGRGTWLLHNGQHHEAVTWLRRAVVEEPASAWPRIFLAQALEGAGQLHAAEEAIRAAMELDSTIADACLVHASILTALERPLDALRTLQGVEGRSGQPAVVKQYEAQAYFVLKQWADVEAAARRGLEHNRDHATLWSLLAAALDRQGRRLEARAAAKEAAHRGDPLMLEALSPGDSSR